MRKFLVLLVLLSVFSALPIFTLAHDLVPAALETYVKDHPNATPEEILQFANEQAPDYVQKFRDGAEIIAIVKNQQTSLLDNGLDFFTIGLRHILSGPDHILFVLSLLLVFLSWKDILKLTTTFTIAHSITLILAGTGLLIISPKIVEPMIALSIAYVAITTVFFPETNWMGDRRGKILAVFFFGLFHGLGFAGLLREIQIPPDKFISSLFAFNVGIEGGQLIIVCCAAPFLFIGRKKHWYPFAIKISAIVIAGIALYWFVERVLGMS